MTDDGSDKNMIRAHPELRDVFSESAQKLGHQPAALAAAVYAYACNIHDLTPILPVVERIAHKHTSLHITANQYGIVGKHLIQAIVDILGDAVTPEVGDAWYNGYWNLAHVCVPPCFSYRILNFQLMYDRSSSSGSVNFMILLSKLVAGKDGGNSRSPSESRSPTRLLAST